MASTHDPFHGRMMATTVERERREPSPINEGWIYNESLGMVTHSSECPDCLCMCQHYVDNTMDNNPTLVLAHQAWDHTLSPPWDTKIDDLKRRQAETCAKLTALHQAISKARGKLAEAQQDRAHLVEANNKPHHQLADASHRVMAQPQDGLEEEHEHHVSTPGPSSFQLHECP